MKSLLLAAALVFLPALARAQTGMQELVDRSTLALQDALNLQASNQPRVSLTHARAALICPQVIKAGFFFGGSGGDCVLVARAANGTWSYPAFYSIGSASFGLQIGLQDSEIVMLIMTNRGLNAILNSSFKIGAGAGIAIAMYGGGVQGDTTAAVGADILAFAISRGAYIGISLEGSILDQLTGWNGRYYGQVLDARQIVINMQGANPGADPLRALLTQYGSQPVVAAAPAYPVPAGGQPYSAASPPPAYQPPAYQPPAYGGAVPGQPINLQPSAPIQQQPLPPPR